MTNRLVAVGDDFTLPAAVKVVDANLPTRLGNTALNATFVPKWKATTAYLAGDKVLSPNGDVISAKANFTSGASYDPANWDLSASVAGKLDKTEAAASYVAYAPGPSGGDDTTALAAAIAAAPVGSRLILKQAAYSASALTINKKMVLDATGATVTQTATGATAKTLLTLSADGAEVRGGTWDGNVSNQTSSNNGIVMTGQDNRCIGVTVQNTKFFGIQARNARPIIDDCFVSNTGYIGIFAETSGTTLTGGRIARCTVDRSMLSAAAIVEGGIKVHGHSDTDRYNNFQIISPVVYLPITPTDDTTLPVEIMWSYNSTITDAITTGGTLGISFADCYNCYASGRTISPSQYGTELARCIDCTVTVTTVGNGVTAKGIDVNGNGTSARNTLLGCHVSGTTNIGIHCESGVVGTQIIGGSVNMSIANSAIQFTNCAHAASTVSGVRLVGNSVGTKAVMLDGTWGVSVVGNAISNFTQNAVLAYATTAVTLDLIAVVGNTILSTPNNALASQLSGGATLGNGSKSFANPGTDWLNFGADQRLLTGLTGAPESAYAGSPGSLYLRKDGNQGKTLYVKETGTGTTGWAAVGSKLSIAVKTASYTAAVNDAGSVIIANGASLTVTLPDPATIGNGVYFVKNINSTALTVATAAGTIDGAATVSLAQYGAGRYISDGSVWRVI